jgi:hypothetical protein
MKNIKLAGDSEKSDRKKGHPNIIFHVRQTSIHGLPVVSPTYLTDAIQIQQKSS